MKQQYAVFEINTYSGAKTFVEIPANQIIEIDTRESVTVLKTDATVFAVISKLDTITFSQIITK